MTLLNAVLLLTPPAGAQGAPAGSAWQTPALFGGIIIIFYFFMIRPQSKKAKEQKKYIDNLQKGDKVITHAGIHGTINKVNEDNTVQLETSPGSYVKLEKSAISQEASIALNKPVVAAEKK